VLNHTMALNESMVHDLDPVLIHIYGDIGIRWYGLSYIMGFIVAYLIMNWLTKRQKAGMNSELISDFITYIALGTIIGGRLGYVFFYSPDLLVKFKADFPFWGVLAVNEGGMASHGGMIGIVLATWLFSRKHGLNFLYLLDLCAVSGPIGVAFGRIANFINGELVGRPAPPDLKWAVKFPQDIAHWPKESPAKLNELAPVVEKMGISPTQWLDWVNQMRSDLAARDNVIDGLNKIITEIQHGNTAVKEALAPLLTPRHPSQLYAALFEGLFVFLVLFFIWRKPQKPGFIAATFIVLYAIVRISDEYFRMPDAHIGFQFLGLTRGQILSIVMLLIGLALMFIWTRSGTFTVQGWGRTRGLKVGRRT
jgi:phosphatidylglycerol---prolipoprotein diacylglyceryl transferase